MKEIKKILFLGLKGDKISEKMILFLNQYFSNVSVASNTNQFNNKYIKKKFDLVINYRSKTILKKSFLDNNYRKIINFHPGTQYFRGIGCANFAIIKNSKIYGAICHFVDEKIDHGDILDVRYFEIKKEDSLKVVIKKSHLVCLQMFYILIQRYIKNNMHLEYMANLNKHIKWSKKLYLKSDMLKLYSLNIRNLKKLKKAQFNRLYSATNYSNYKIILSIFGQKYKLVKINEKK